MYFSHPPHAFFTHLSQTVLTWLQIKVTEKQLLRELGRVEYSGEIYKKIEQKITTTAEKVVFEETITEKVVDGLTKIANSKIEESMKDGAKKIAD